MFYIVVDNKKHTTIKNLKKNMFSNFNKKNIKNVFHIYVFSV